MDTERLQQRVNGRNQAIAVMDLITLESPHAIAAFFEELNDRLRPEKIAVEREQRRRKVSELKAVELNFGKHAGKCLDDIPRDYLHWLASSNEDTLATINEYLRLTESDEEPTP
jgi:uncharacterized protein (DUF3820 family)